MDYMIFDSAGNALESFDSEMAAVIALINMAETNEDAARQLAVLSFDDAGEVAGDAVTVADVRPEIATTMVVGESGWGVDRLTMRGPWATLTGWWRADGLHGAAAH